MYSNTHVLVTGGAGFIGSHLVGQLRRALANVRILDNFSTGRQENLEEEGCDSKFEYCIGDIRDPETCRRACNGVDVVFHLAAYVSVPGSIENPELNDDINIAGTRTVFEAAVAAGVRRIVYASSAAVYGDAPESVKVVTAERRYTSPYGASKGVCEDLAAEFAARYPDLVIVGLRYFNVYGPRQDPTSAYSGVISRFMDAAVKGERVTLFGDGTQTRDFIYVGDVAHFTFMAGRNNFPKTMLRPGAHVFNIGTGVGTSLNDLLTVLPGGNTVERQYLPERPGDVKHSVADMSHTQAGLRRHYRIRSLEDGLNLYHKWLLGLRCCGVNCISK
jgi:nucleoside-diphosphate-sugar epimerase